MSELAGGWSLAVAVVLSVAVAVVVIVAVAVTVVVAVAMDFIGFGAIICIRQDS